MKRAILWIVVIAVILILGFAFLKQGDDAETSSDTLVQGTNTDTTAQPSIETDEDVLNEIDSALDALE